MGFCPSDLITVPSSLVVMVPSPSLSNKLKASLNSVENKSKRSNKYKDLKSKSVSGTHNYVACGSFKSEVQLPITRDY